MNEFTAVHFLDFEGRTMKFNDIYLVTNCKKYLFSKSTCVAGKCNFPSPDAYLYFYLNLHLYPGQVDTRQFAHKFISLCFSRDEKAEWVYETKTNMKGEKIYSHTMCLPCHK